ncbi:MAG TPA: O-sialoglycoprotein endopeptidase [Clostridiales bacterium]|nr:O-sialoglycoprotein endopeptidase [Clostridiales bacterium]
MEGYALGIDTSCYTTSFAIMTFDGKLIYNSQIPLEVDKGKLGLRQSHAIFKHLKNIPSITGEIAQKVDTKKIKIVCSTTRPRPIKDSYMPVFVVSSVIGKTIADFLSVPFYTVSHQECHIMAGRYSANGPHGNEFLAVHFSGGTSELLKVLELESGFHIDIIGGTQDLHAGQFVDRMGVAMGLEFPAGPHLEELAELGEEGVITLPIFVRGTTIGFSGAETYTKKLLKNGHRKEDIAISIYNCLADTLYKWLINGIEITRLTDVLLVGGVTSSNLLKRRLYTCFKKDGQNRDINLFFADPKFAKDNAIGAALLGIKYYEGMRNCEG